MIWTLVAAKAKQGVNAANTKNSESIGQAAKKGIMMVVLIALACGMKLSGDNKMLDNFFNDEIKGINLAQSHSNVERRHKKWFDEEEEDEDFSPYYEDEDEDDMYDDEDMYNDEEIYDDEDMYDEDSYAEEEEEDSYDFENEDSYAEEEEEDSYEEEYQPRHHHDHRRKENRNRHHHDNSEEDWQPRRHHRGPRGFLAAKQGETMYQTLQKRLRSDPLSFKKEIRVAGAFTVIFLAAIVVSFFSLLTTYKKSVAKHEFLLSIYQNPKAKVVPTHRAQEFIEHKKLEAKHKRTLKAQKAIEEEYTTKMAEIVQIQQTLIAKNPAFLQANTYMPPQIDEEAGKQEYNYSLCESIDYQQPIIKTEQPVPELET